MEIVTTVQVQVHTHWKYLDGGEGITARLYNSRENTPKVCLELGKDDKIVNDLVPLGKEFTLIICDAESKGFSQDRVYTLRCDKAVQEYHRDDIKSEVYLSSSYDLDAPFVSISLEWWNSPPMLFSGGGTMYTAILREKALI